jgi:3-oxoacyl-[acyl-carrier-protein] synthase III
MLRLTSISFYLPETEVDNLELCNKFSTSPEFIKEKIGVSKRRIKNEDDTSSSLCLKAFEQLQKDYGVCINEIDCCIVVTQNPDQNIPHVSAIVHGALGLNDECATFDISLGCSGYVYALSVLKSFMTENDLQKGLLFTSDQYSNIIDPDDKNTVMIFGDGASVSILEKDKSGFEILSSDFGSRGSGWKALQCKSSLHMNGREVFNFTASTVPKSIKKVLEKAQLKEEDISRWYLHQGSKYIVDTIAQRAHLPPSKVAFDMLHYGNTVSSSIPIMLSKDFCQFEDNALIGISGFGVGLSWGTTILKFKKG